MRSTLVFWMIGLLLTLGLAACGSDDKQPAPGCTPGYPDCGCATGNACLTGLTCQNAKCAPSLADGDNEAELCTPGYKDCACAANDACLQGLSCENAKCAPAVADGDTEGEACTPGYEGCGCALGTACLSGLSCENASCRPVTPDGDADSDGEAEATACTCPDYLGNYCVGILPFNPVKAAVKTGYMIVVDSYSADPLDCRERATYMINSVVQASHVFDRCTPDFPVPLDHGASFDFDPATRHFSITQPMTRKDDVTELVYDFAADYCPNEHCFNDVKDLDETDKDCGGTTCIPCAEGKACTKDRDCQSRSCYGNACVLPLCGDGKHTSNEACDDGNTEAGDGCDANCSIEQGWKCESVDKAPDNCSCDASVCPPSNTPCQIPACSKEQGCFFTPSEEGTPLADDVSGDCQTAVCDGQGGIKKVADNTDKPADANACSVGICEVGVPKQDALPQDTPCTAGNLTGYCDGLGVCFECNRDAQCEDTSKPYCTNHLCQAASCEDGRQNGLETGPDCGGATTCLRCAINLGCAVDSDCVSAICGPQKTCAVCRDDSSCPNTQRCANFSCVDVSPGCTDNMKDGTETDIDCGGSGGCRRCLTNKTCNQTTDCQSGVCTGGICKAQ